MEEVSNFCPAMAVPMTVKIPDPITAPMPSAVSDTGPSVFFRRRSGSSDSEISLSMDLQQKSWFLPAFRAGSGPLLVVGDWDNRPHSRRVIRQKGGIFCPPPDRESLAFPPCRKNRDKGGATVTAWPVRAPSS